MSQCYKQRAQDSVRGRSASGRSALDLGNIRGISSLTFPKVIRSNRHWTSLNLDEITSSNRYTRADCYQLSCCWAAFPERLYTDWRFVDKSISRAEQAVTTSKR